VIVLLLGVWIRERQERKKKAAEGSLSSNDQSAVKSEQL